MIRALTTLVAIAALAVSAAPASAGSSKKPPPRIGQVVVLIGANDHGLVAKPPPRSATGIVTDNKDPDKLGLASKAPPKPRRHQLATDVPDGTSNTMMWSGSLKPPNGIIAILIG